MSDIVERLRKDAFTLDGDVADPLLEEAACEIERLREAWVDEKMRKDRDALAARLEGMQDLYIQACEQRDDAMALLKNFVKVPTSPMLAPIQAKAMKLLTDSATPRENERE